MAGLTDEQREFWDEIGFKPLASKDEDEVNRRVAGLRAAFHFDGYQPPPSREAIIAEFERRGGGERRAA